MSLLEREAADVVMTPDNLRARRLPWFLDLGIAIAALIVAALIVLPAGLGNWVLVVAVAAVLYLLGLNFLASRIEGKRSARNRMWRAAIYAACVLAILPLASVVWTLVSKGLARFDGDFFNSSMNNITPSSARWSRWGSPRSWPSRWACSPRCTWSSTAAAGSR
jgi:phosphate transport system permease protein